MSKSITLTVADWVLLTNALGVAENPPARTPQQWEAQLQHHALWKRLADQLGPLTGDGMSELTIELEQRDCQDLSWGLDCRSWVTNALGEKWRLQKALGQSRPDGQVE